MKRRHSSHPDPSTYRALRANHGLWMLVVTVLALGTLQFSIAHGRAFLSLYFLPVLLGAYVLGRREGMSVSVFAVLVGGTVGLVTLGLDAGVQAEWWPRIVDLGGWALSLALSANVVGSLSDQRRLRLGEIQRAHEAVLAILISSVDRETRNHSSRVADDSVEVARTLGLPESTVEDIRVGAWLHDIGRVSSTMEVLRKAAGPVPENRSRSGKRPRTGLELPNFSDDGILTHVIPIVACQLERWDGSGSRHIKGNAIPIGARIIAVAHTFDTIATHGPHRMSRDPVAAIQVIRTESGQAFDPQVVDAFLKHRAVRADGLKILPRLQVGRKEEAILAGGRNGSGGCES